MQLSDDFNSSILHRVLASGKWIFCLKWTDLATTYCVVITCLLSLGSVDITTLLYKLVVSATAFKEIFCLVFWRCELSDD